MKNFNTTTLPGFLEGRGIGFDRMFDLINDATNYTRESQKFPPHNVIQIDEDNYAIELAIAGFASEDLELTQDGNKLSIEGNTAQIDEETIAGPKYLHKGISTRAFKREFVLADHVVVEDATFENGIVTIKLHLELPDEMKPRTIDIKRVGK